MAPSNPVPNDCESCDISGFQQTQFLGLTVRSVSASMGYGAQPSELTVDLVEDNCTTTKHFYNECGNHVSTTDPDPGFFGENRYERVDGSQYSSLAQEDDTDTKIRDALGLVGGPAYFRLNTSDTSFEWAGIISDWVRSDSPDSPPTYRVRLLDPRIILQGVQLIIGDYSGRVDQFSVQCPTMNLFNLFGFSALFGNICPPWTQCFPGTYDYVGDHLSNPAVTCPGYLIDGEVFGTWMGGFSGSYANESGMTLRSIIDSFNVLANSSPSLSNEFSFYGRVMYYAYEIPPELSGIASGLMEYPDYPLCLQNKFDYYVDMSEVPIYDDYFYRIAGTTISLLDLLQKLSEDFNFDFYVDLLPVKTGGSPCLARFIKVQVIYRNSARSPGQIAQFLQDQDCVQSKQVGVELRAENNSKFIVGAPKVSVYQGFQHLNPDSGFTVPANDANTIASINNLTNTIDTISSSSSMIDDTIIPYFGQDEFGNLIVPFPTGAYLPTGKLNNQMLALKLFPGVGEPWGYKFITYTEMLFVDFDMWIEYITRFQTSIYIDVLVANGDIRFNQRNALKPGAIGVFVLRDLANPIMPNAQVPNNAHGVQGPINVQLWTEQILHDLHVIFDWITSYGRDYLGKKYAVRVPFTCANYDPETNRIKISDQPTNEGGWTEMPTVLGITNYGNLSYGREYDLLNKFRDDQGRIRPFVRMVDPIAINLNDLNKDDYGYSITFIGGEFGSGPPTEFTDGWVYTDTDNGEVYFIELDIAGNNQWVHWTVYNGIYYGVGPPPSTIIKDINAVAPVHYLLYADLLTGQYYIAVDKANNGLGDQIDTDWNVCSISVYIKAEVQENYVFHSVAAQYAPRVIIELPTNLTYKVPGWFQDFGGAGVPAVKAIDWSDYSAQELRSPAMINSAAIPIRSNVLSYGPWYNPALAANTDVIVDDSLAPWNFNGYAGMNLAGALMATEGRSNMYWDEFGSITVLGYPNIPLGAELNSTPGTYDYVDTRTTDTALVSGIDFNNNPVSYNYFVVDYRSAWSGLDGPNVTEINITVSDGGEVTTTYTMRSFVPRSYGMNKWIINRMRTISTLYRGLVADIRNVKQSKGRLYGYEV